MGCIFSCAGLLYNFFVVTLKTKTQPFSSDDFHIIKRTLNIGNRYHFQGIVRRSEQVEINRVPDGRIEDCPDSFARYNRGLEIIV